MAISKTRPEGSVTTNENLLVLAGPKGSIANLAAPTKTELDAAAMIDITYSLTASGYKHTPGEEKIEDSRLTLAQALKKPGAQTDELELQYVYGSENPVADALFKRGQEYVIAVRYAVPHNDDIAAGQKFDVFPMIAGRPRRDAPTNNSVFTKTLSLDPAGRVEENVEVTN